MILWIGSYPKSGNTWVRALLSSYLYANGGFDNFDVLKNILNWDRSKFNSFLSLQDCININNKTLLLKTHSAHADSFVNPRNTQAIIHIVRDPRNVITSLANHYSITNEEAYNFLTQHDKVISEAEKDGKLKGITTPIGSWGQHYGIWKKVTFAPFLMVKYEDLVKDTPKEFRRILNFVNKQLLDQQKEKREIDEKKFLKTLENCTFEKLKQMEKDQVFEEAPPISPAHEEIKHRTTFFHLGPKNNCLISSDLEKRIKTIFADEMKELNYV